MMCFKFWVFFILFFRFKGIQYYLIAIGVFMAISVLVLFIVISLIQRAFYELIYNGVVTSWTNLRYTMWVSNASLISSRFCRY